MVRRLENVRESSKETIFIDGTKLEVAANQYMFVREKSAEKWQEKMFLTIQQPVEPLNQEHLQPFLVLEESKTQHLQKIFRFLEQVCEA